MTFVEEMIAGIGHIFKAPFADLSVLWLIIPLFIIWFILEIYFGTHKKEKLGWNTALGNGISMFWIAVNLMRHLFENQFASFTGAKLGAVIIIFSYSLFISYISFTHKFASKVTYKLAAPTPVYYLSGVAILWAYGSLTISLAVLADLIILFGIVLLIVLILRKTLPEEKEDGEGSDLGGKTGGDLGGGLEGGLGNLGSEKESSGFGGSSPGTPNSSLGKGLDEFKL